MSTYIAVGPHCWGRGATPEIAKRGMNSYWPSGLPKRECGYVVYETEETSYVTDHGQIHAFKEPRVVEDTTVELER